MHPVGCAQTSSSAKYSFFHIVDSAPSSTTNLVPSISSASGGFDQLIDAGSRLTIDEACHGLGFLHGQSYSTPDITSIEHYNELLEQIVEQRYRM